MVLTSEKRTLRVPLPMNRIQTKGRKMGGLEENLFIRGNFKIEILKSLPIKKYFCKARRA
jgi:hypothetical protein